MQVKQLSQKESFFILVFLIKSEKFMMEQLLWIGWNKKEKEE